MFPRGHNKIPPIPPLTKGGEGGFLCEKGGAGGFSLQKEELGDSDQTRGDNREGLLGSCVRFPSGGEGEEDFAS